MVSSASEFPLEDYHDYIISGGGTAGCPLAATLSQSHRVLILKRGRISHGRPSIMNQGGFLNTNANNVNSRDSPAHSFISEDGALNTRGCVLDESNAINAGFYSRANREFFYEFWFALGFKTCEQHSNLKIAIYASVERLLLASTPSSFSSANSAATSSPAIGVIHHDENGKCHHAILRD